MIYLTAAQVLFIHSRLVAETGGATGVRDLGLLLAAISRPQATFDGEELYPNLFQKAAALMFSIVQNHPFVDGNKRTGITAAGIFLRVNGYKLIAENKVLELFTLNVAQGKMDVASIASWLEANSLPLAASLP